MSEISLNPVEEKLPNTWEKKNGRVTDVDSTTGRNEIWSRCQAAGTEI
jgi:hypothetical protein